MFNLVGCQTRMRYGDQKRVFGLVPALARAEYLRHSQVHRNTFLQHSVALDPYGRPKGGAWPGLFFAGQLTGVEGYVESIMSGLVAAWNAVRVLEGRSRSSAAGDHDRRSLRAISGRQTRSAFSR